MGLIDDERIAESNRYFRAGRLGLPMPPIDMISRPASDGLRRSYDIGAEARVRHLNWLYGAQAERATAAAKRNQSRPGYKGRVW